MYILLERERERYTDYVLGPRAAPDSFAQHLVNFVFQKCETPKRKKDIYIYIYIYIYNTHIYIYTHDSGARESEAPRERQDILTCPRSGDARDESLGISLLLSSLLLSSSVSLLKQQHVNNMIITIEY